MPVKPFFIFWLQTIFILNKLNILNKKLQNINLISKTCIKALAGYAQVTLKTATKLNYIIKYSHYITKQMLR